jgi:hypothetical protein
LGLSKGVIVMPTSEECTNLKVAHASLDKRVDAIAERLDEVLDEIKAIRAWASKWGTALMLVALLGKDAIPILSKVFGITG